MSAPSQHLTKTEAALRSIRSRIHSGELPPGTHLQVLTLAEELDMSHTPVREALRVLSADGLVEFRSHRGAVVAETSMRLEQIWRLRALLEPEAVRLAVPRLGEERIRRLEDLHAELSHSSPLQRSTKNQTWHFGIYDECDSPILLSFIKRLWDLVPWRTVWMLPGRGETSMQEHDAVMAALRDRDGDVAAAAMRVHILSALDSVTEQPHA